MKKPKLYLFVFLGSIFASGVLYAQTDPFADKPANNPNSNTLDASVGVPSNEIQDKDPNAKAIPIPSDDMFDLIFEYPCAIGGGEAGIETDGVYIYTTKWNGNHFYKYDIYGTFLDTIIIPGVSNIRDLAWNGTFFFGGAASPTVYEVDFENATLISTYTAPTDVRAIAYNEDEDVFYANNWGSDIIKFDITGANLGSFPIGPVGDSYYGFAYEGTNITWAEPFLWGYAQVGATQNELVQIELPSGYETGVYFDVGSVVSIFEGYAGGLCIHPLANVFALVGMSQNEYLWGLELAYGWLPPDDLGIQSILEPVSGVGGYTNSESVTVRIENYGWNPQSDIIVSFTHNGSSPYFDTAFTTIISGDTCDFTFDTTIDMSMGGVHLIEACTHLAGDGNVFNDCKTKILEGGLFGSIEGYLTDCITSAPIANGDISLGSGLYFTTTGPDGYFIIEEILAGTWELNYSAPGYCLPQEQLMVTIVEGQTTTIDNLCLYPAQFEVDPVTINIELEPNYQTQEVVTLSNPGNCEIEWNATILFNNKKGTDEMFDLIWEVPVGVGGGEAGIETNGNYIYTTKWNGTGEYYRYGMDGTYMEEIMVVGAAATRDMAYDGTYFYGGSASTTVYQLDLDNVTLVSTITAPTDCRAIAYNHDEDVFYANNWGSNITKFDKTGINLGSFACGPVGDNYYGFAYDNSEGSPFLWGYAQVGATQNELIQIELPSGIETGLTFDIGSSLSSYNIAGGLAIDNHVAPGLWAFLGTSQDFYLWAAELGPAAPVWLTIDPTSDTLEAGTTENMDLYFDATDLLPGYYFAQVQFSTTPYVGEAMVEVTLYVEGVMPPTNLTGYFDCTDVYLTWEMPTGGVPDSWKVYRNGNEIAEVFDMEYTDIMVDPEVEYSYTVTAVYAGEESQPTTPLFITVPTPESLEPFDLEAIMHYPGDFDVTLLWEEPDACLSPDGYNIFRNDEQINLTLVTETTYIDPSLTYGFYEYYVTAVYYFGESDPSDPTYALFYDIDEFNFEICRIYPNPSDRLLNIESGYPIGRIQIFDIHGKFLIDKIINCKKSRIDISFFEPGIYFLKIQTKNAIFNQKIILQ